MVIRNHVGGYFLKAEARTRFYYYPETYASSQGYAHWMPTVWVNGMNEQTGAWTNVNTTWSAYHDMIVNWLFVPTSLAIDLKVEYGDKADTGMVYVQVIAEGVVGFTDLRLRMALTEDNITYSLKHYDQILRDYLPNPNGISFTIAQGDTFKHSEQFVMETGWNAANCNLVAFVQNDTERMVVQCAQTPVPASTPVVTETYPGNLPEGYQLSQNFPNPFNPETEIQYAIPQDGRVSLKVYNITGAQVATLVSGEQTAGSYSVRWNARDLASGVYFCRLEAGEYSEMVKMVLMR